MSTKSEKDRALKKWLTSERKRSEKEDKMLLEQSRRHKALEKRNKIKRIVIER